MLGRGHIDDIDVRGRGGREQDDSSPRLRQKKRSSFQVGDRCFVNCDGALCPGTIIKVLTRRGHNVFYCIKLDKHQEEGPNIEDEIPVDNKEEEEETVMAEACNIFDPDDRVPSLKKKDKRTRAASPWQTSRAKCYYQKRLLDDNDSIHNKTEEDIFFTSFYDDGEPVVQGKYALLNFKKNFRSMK